MKWTINIEQAMRDRLGGRGRDGFSEAESQDAHVAVMDVLHLVTPEMIRAHADLSDMETDDDVSRELSYAGCAAAAVIASDTITILSDDGKRRREAIHHFFA